MGLPEVATRQWTRTEIYHPIKTAQSSTTRQVIDLQIDIANGKLDQLDNARAQLDVERLKASDDAIKARVDVQIRKIDRDTAALNDQLRTLRNIQAQQPN
jgi:diphthamide synthase subunit DPH2